jgi:hypothetical protein
MIGIALQTQCRCVAEEQSGGVDVLKNFSDVAFEVGPREVGESRGMVWMADRTLIQNQLEMLYSVVQVKDGLVCHELYEAFEEER